jgi:hypothetical protein
MNNNKVGMVGIGRVVNGRITFTDASGKGFSRPVVKEVVKEEVIAPVVMAKKEKEEIVLDIPDFMKNRKRKPAPKNNVVEVQFRQHEEEEEEDRVVQFVDNMEAAIKNKIYNSRVFKYFFDVEE